MQNRVSDFRLAVIAPYDAVRIVLGLLLLTAAALKGHQLATEPVAETGWLTSRWFLIAVVEFELFFGLWLLAGPYPRGTWTAALMCFSGFACISLSKALSGEVSCGCFGRVEIDPWYTLVLDLAGTGALLRWRVPKGGESVAGGRRFLRLRPVALVGVSLVLGIPAAVAMGSCQTATLGEDGNIFGDSEFVVLYPETWIGKRFPLLGYIDIGGRLAEGEWTLLLYRHGCPKCQQAIVLLEQQAEDAGHRSGARSIALVEMPPYSGKPTLRHRNFPMGRLSDTKDWLGSTPVKVVLKDGNVTRVSGHGL